MSRVLSRSQIHWDKWSTECEKGGPFQKIWDPSDLPIYDVNGLSPFRQIRDLGTVKLFLMYAFKPCLENYR